MDKRSAGLSSKRTRRSTRKRSKKPTTPTLKRQTIVRSAKGPRTKGQSEPETLVPLDILKKQVERGEELNLHKNVPTIETMRKMNKIVEDYLKKTERIIYGGTAIDALLKAKGIILRDDVSKLIDYDFYSPLYEVDSVAIANELFAKGYKYVRRVPAIHQYTFRVGAEFASEFIADISYIPSEVYGKIPKVKIGDFYYIDPQFAKIDLYKSVTNPHTNVVRWVKSYRRLVAMEKMYPIAKSKLKELHVPDPINPKLQEAIKRAARNGTSLLATGIYAYNLYASLVPGIPLASGIAQYEFYAIDPFAEAKRIMTTLKRAGFKSVSAKQYYSYLEIYPPKTVIYYQKQPIVSLYLIGENCLGVREIEKTNVVNYHVLLMFLYGKYNVDGVIGRSLKIRELYAWLIQTLQEAFKEYNNAHGTTGLEPDNPFQVFQTDCLSFDPEEARLSAYKRFFYGTVTIPLYKPEKVRIDPSQLKEIYPGNFLGEEVDEQRVTRQMGRLQSEYIKLGLATMKKVKVPKQSKK